MYRSGTELDLLGGSTYISIDLKNPSKILSGQVQDLFI
jgi:hypothetical protein